MKNSRVFYTYLAGGFIALGLLIYEIVISYPKIDIYPVIGNGALALLFFTFSYKAYHEKKDKELM